MINLVAIVSVTLVLVLIIVALVFLNHLAKIKSNSIDTQLARAKANATTPAELADLEMMARDAKGIKRGKRHE